MHRIAPLLAILLFPSAAAAAGVSLGVAEDIDAAMTVTERDAGVWTVEAHNTGSGPIHGRVHLAVTRNGTTVFTVWSDLVTLQPGEAVSRTLSAPPSVSGDGAMTFRYGAYTTPPQTVEVIPRPNASSLTITTVWAFPERVRVGVDAPPGRTVFVTVGDGSTRVFAQQHVRTGAGRTLVTVPVHPRLEGEAALTVTAHTGDGRYSTTVTRETPVRTGLAGMVWNLVDWVAASRVFTWF